jgi:hypothetical protein
MKRNDTNRYSQSPKSPKSTGGKRGLVIVTSSKNDSYLGRGVEKAGDQW